MIPAELILTEGLTKAYGHVIAVESLGLEIRRAEVFGLLGPNGSGKTTTIRLLLGLLRPNAGWAKVGGFDCWRQSLDVRQLVSYLPGELRMYGSMSGFGMLKLLSDLRDGAGLDRAVAIAERLMKLNLRRTVRTYSTGMKQKLALAQVFADPVNILILDEPTSAPDPSARSLVISLVQEARNSGQTVIFSGHVLAEVEQVADRVAIMRRGRLMHVEDMHARRKLSNGVGPVRRRPRTRVAFRARAKRRASGMVKPCCLSIAVSSPRCYAGWQRPRFRTSQLAPRTCAVYTIAFTDRMCPTRRKSCEAVSCPSSQANS